MTARMKSIALAAFAASSLPLFGATYSYNTMTWSDTVSIGQWTSRYNDAKVYAKSSNKPMVVVWANPGCGYCAAFENAIGANAEVKAWAEGNGYILVFALGYDTKDELGMTASDVNAAFNFASVGIGKFPLIGIWWSKNDSGKEVKARMEGRSGLMPEKRNGLARQFMDSVDYYLGKKDIVYKITFNANGGGNLSESSRDVSYGKPAGPLPTATRAGYALTGWSTVKSGGAGTTVSSSTKVTNSATLYAQWKRVVTLTLEDSPAGEGKLVGAGQYNEGETVAVKTAPKNGGIFSCWKDDKGNVVSDIQKFKYPLGGEDVTLTAYFISKQEDLDSISFKVDNSTWTESDTPDRTLEQGVAVDWPVSVGAKTVATPSFSGLPSGLKLVKDKGTGAYSIAGVPTAVSKADKNGNVKPSAVTLKIKTSGGNAKTYKMAITVKARPSWTEGVFNGYVDAAPDMGEPVGLVFNLTVAANGKVSGKLLRDGLTYTLSAPSLILDGSTYKAMIDGKAKGSVVSYIATFSKKDVASYTYGIITADKQWYAYQTPWKTNDKLKALAKKMAKAPPLTLPGELGGYGDLVLKVGANGVVSVKGGGVSSSSVLIPFSEEPADLRLCLYLAPKKAFPGYASRIVLKWDGERFSL